jgi:hypothetical protein
MDPIWVVSCISDEEDIKPGKEKPIDVGSSVLKERAKQMKLLSSYQGLDIWYSVGRNIVPALLVQCQFVKLRGDSIAVCKLHGRISNESESDSDSSSLHVEIGDYLHVQGKKAYVVQEICNNGTARCASPTFPKNEPIVLTIEEANQSMLLGIK